MRRRRLRIVHETVFILGIALIAAAIVGGGLKAAGTDVPVIHSVARQVVLAMIGLVTAALSLLGGEASDAHGAEALALMTKPKPEGAFTGIHEGGSPVRWAFVVRNPSEFDASDVVIEVQRRDGRKVRSTTKRLCAGQSHEDGFQADVGPITSPYPAEMEFLRLVTIDYSDAHGFARWRQRYNFTFSRTGQFVSGSKSFEEERIK